jgi:DNA-binding response OmpR family regulator
MKLLIAEDEPDLNRLLVRRLSKEGHSVKGVFDGISVLESIEEDNYDVLVIDIMMPSLDGIQTVRRLRELGNEIPVIFLTAKDSVDDRIHGLDIGADDYIVKPFFFEELSARIAAVFRRCQSDKSGLFRLEDLTVDATRLTVKRGGENIELSSKEYSILNCLVKDAGNVVTREQIMNSVWNTDYTGNSNIIDVYIRCLRDKIDSKFEKKLIHTVRGVGYILKSE